MSSSWLILALCKWKVLDTVYGHAMLQSPAFKTVKFADLSNVSVDGGVEIFKPARLEVGGQGKCRRH